MAEVSPPPECEVGRRTTLTGPIAVVVCGILVLVASLLVASLYYQHRNYSNGVIKALNDATLDHAAVLSYSRAWDIAVLKTSGICCGFLLAFLGALYVLRTRDSEYVLTLRGLDKENTLKTSSPGLVIVTLGVVLVITSILKETSVTYEAPTLAPGSGTRQPDIPAEPEPLSSTHVIPRVVPTEPKPLRSTHVIPRVVPTKPEPLSSNEVVPLVVPLQWSVHNSDQKDASECKIFADRQAYEEGLTSLKLSVLPGAAAETKPIFPDVDWKDGETALVFAHSTNGNTQYRFSLMRTYDGSFLFDEIGSWNVPTTSEVIIVRVPSDLRGVANSTCTVRSGGGGGRTGLLRRGGRSGTRSFKKR